MAYQTIRIKLRTTEVSVYAGARVAKALEEISGGMAVYEGVKLDQILEAVYKQGVKDGARQAFDALDRQVADVKKQIPHKNPGRPRTRRPRQPA